MEIYKPGDWGNLDQEKIKKIQEHLIIWYKKNHRKLPWRDTNNPYYIWISEVMLQQTRVDTVIPYFLNFIKKFPTVEILGNADEEEVLKAWEGLGYYSRAKNIHRGAKLINCEYEGIIPNTLKEIKSIPGIGPYTAGAILSIAYNQAVPAVDGNVMRVFSRLFNIWEDIGEGNTKKEMEKIGQVMVSKKYPSFFNQSLMELGALICIPLSPKCIACPVYSYCNAKALGVEGSLPVKKKKTKVREVEIEVGVIWKREKFLITKRPPQGLLGDLWALPSIERDQNLKEGESIRLELEETYGIKGEEGTFIFEKEHVFTHRKWKMKIYFFKIGYEGSIDYPKANWISLDEMKNYPFPRAFMKIIEELYQYR